MMWPCIVGCRHYHLIIIIYSVHWYVDVFLSGVMELFCVCGSGYLTSGIDRVDELPVFSDIAIREDHSPVKGVQTEI